MAKVTVTCGPESSSGRAKVTKRVSTVKAGKAAAKACSRQYRGYWADVSHRGRLVASCLNGRCKKG